MWAGAVAHGRQYYFAALRGRGGGASIGDGVRRRVGVVVAAGGTGAALATATPRCAQCELSMAESACCMLTLGALQLGLAARWTLYPEALARDFGRVPPTESQPEMKQAGVFSEHVDQGSGRTYYCNVATREVAWKLPPGAAVQEKERDADDTVQQSNVEEKHRDADAERVTEA
eukprot:COSAG02_NODE_3004_length_7571_cov_65.586188_5_plen_174_part_00